MNKLFNVLVLVGLPAASACSDAATEEADGTDQASGETDPQPASQGSATSVVAASSGAVGGEGGTAGSAGTSAPAAEPSAAAPPSPPSPAAEPSAGVAPSPPSPAAEPSAGMVDEGAPASTPDCPPEQWTCEALTCSDQSCSDCAVWQEPQGCSCDLTRPRQASDCGPDENFVCDTLDASISERGRLSCACVAADVSEQAACSQNNPQHQTAAGDDFLCSCAWVLIR